MAYFSKPRLSHAFLFNSRFAPLSIVLFDSGIPLLIYINAMLPKHISRGITSEKPHFFLFEHVTSLFLLAILVSINSPSL